MKSHAEQIMHLFTEKFAWLVSQEFTCVLEHRSELDWATAMLYIDGSNAYTRLIHPMIQRTQGREMTRESFDVEFGGVVQQLFGEMIREFHYKRITLNDAYTGSRSAYRIDRYPQFTDLFCCSNT